MKAEHISWSISCDVYKDAKAVEDGIATEDGIWLSPDQLSLSVRALVEKEIRTHVEKNL